MIEHLFKQLDKRKIRELIYDLEMKLKYFSTDNTYEKFRIRQSLYFLERIKDYLEIDD